MKKKLTVQSFIPIEEKIRLITSSDDPKGLMETLPEEEVWLAVKKASPEEALVILENTTKEQLQYILDIELWKKDRFLPEASLEWLETLKECGKKKVLQWVHESDMDAVVLTFKKFVEVRKKENSEDNPMEQVWPGPNPPSTLDGVYFFQFIDERADGVLGKVFDYIAKDDHSFFVKLCDALMYELPSNLEEEAFNWRNKRLAEKGFVPFDEAVHIYQLVNEKDFKNLPRRPEAAVGKVGGPGGDVYPLALHGEAYPLLMMALREIKDTELLENIKLELISIANRALIADARPIIPESIESSLKKAMGYVNVGLEKLSGADAKKAGAILKERFIVDLFRMGHSVVTKVRQHAKKFVSTGWPRLVEGDLSMLGEDMECSINALLRKRPLYFAGGQEEVQYHEFKSLDEIRSVERKIEKADYIGRMFKDVFKLSPEQLKVMAIEKEPVLFSMVFLTIWAKGVATGNYGFSPLTLPEFKKVMKLAFGKEIKDSSMRSFKLEMITDFQKWMIKRQPNISASEERSLKEFTSECFNLFVEEFFEISEKADVDPRFVQSIWVIGSSA